MVVRYLLIAVLALLAACQPALQATPTSEYVPPVEPETVDIPVDNCTNVTCPSGQMCQNGVCGCASGEKECDGECIDEDDCCTDKDCTSGYCEEGVCLAAEECRYGEVLKNGRCECGPNMKSCPEQGKCIDRDACCIHGMCDIGYERCVPTGWRTRICVENGNKTQCKSIADNAREEYFSLEKPLRVNATEFWSNGDITFNINNESVRIEDGEKIEHASNVTLFHEGIEVTGGFCKEDVDD